MKDNSDDDYEAAGWEIVDRPPSYGPSPANSGPSAPPAYFQSHPGDRTKGIDWSLNSRPSNHGNAERGSAPSAPSYSEVRAGTSSKGVDWSLNRPEAPARTVSRTNPPLYPGPSPHLPVNPGSRDLNYPRVMTRAASSPNVQGSAAVRSKYPVVSNSTPPQDPSCRFAWWKTEFSRHYPGAKLSRDTPSILKMEIPKNRAFPPVGHATCPDCFDHGPHQTQYVKKKDGILSYKKLPAQKCRRCFKLVYFIHSNDLAEDHLPRDKPPPYTNRPSQIGFSRQTLDDFGHGWGSSEDGHGWDPGEGEGHGWGRP